MNHWWEFLRSVFIPYCSLKSTRAPQFGNLILILQGRPPPPLIRECAFNFIWIHGTKPKHLGPSKRVLLCWLEKLQNEIRIRGVLNPNLTVRMVFPVTEEIFGPAIINNIINNTIIIMIIVESLVNPSAVVFPNKHQSPSARGWHFGISGKPPPTPLIMEYALKC